MSSEYKYSSVEGTLSVNNKLIDEENNVNEKDTEDTFVKMTIEDRVSDSNNSKTFLYIAACVANLAALTAGITLGWTSPELPKLADNSTTPLPAPATIEESSWIGSLLPLGAAIGPFAAGQFADKIGRKKTLLLIIVPFILAFACASIATDVSLFYLVRFAFGLSVGGVFTVLPMYIGEIADDSVRGALGSIMQLFVTGGLLLAYSVGPYVSITMFNTACLIPPSLFLIIFLMFIPESPYFLLAQNNEEEGIKALSKLRSTSDVKSELEELKKAVEESKKNKGSFLDVFKTAAYKKAMMLSVGLVTFQQFSGINIVLFYTYEVTGNSMPSDVSTIMVGVMQVGFSFITPAFVERKGKRFLLLASSIGMAASLGGLGYYFRLKDLQSPTDSVFWLPLLSLVVYNAAYCAGFGPLPWAIMGELFPANVKSAAATLTAAICWFLGFLITKYFSIVAAAIGNGMSFYFFGACCVLATLFVYKLVPETSGKSLQEIQIILEGRDKK